MADILRWETRKTRKPHRCFGCQKTHPIGVEMVNAAYADGGRVFDCYWCITCEKYMQKYFEYGDEISEGEIYENDPEGWEQIRVKTEGTE